MVASKASDIPEWESKYCPCKGCGVAREEGRQEIIYRIRKLHQEIDGIGVKVCAVCIDDNMHWSEQTEYPCPTIKALDGDK